MNSRDIDDLMRMQDIMGENSTQRLIEQVERNALRETGPGLDNLARSPFSRMSGAERRFLTRPQPEFECLAALRALEAGGDHVRAAEAAFERMRQIEDAASKSGTGGELFDYFERSGRAGRRALAALKGHEQIERSASRRATSRWISAPQVSRSLPASGVKPSR